MKLPSRRKKIHTYILTSKIIGFLLLIVFVTLSPAAVIDREFSEEVQEFHHPLFDGMMKLVSYPGYMPYAPIMVILTAFAFNICKFKREALFVLFTMLSGLVSTIIKFLVNRPRPGSDMVKIALETHQQSFPSGHVMFYIIFFGFLILLMYMLKGIHNAIRIVVGILSTIMIVTIPISRIYLGAHWLTDVIGAFLLGMLCLYALGYFYLKKPQQA